MSLGDATGAAAWISTGLSVAALVPAGARWSRVAQREHYLPGASSRFAFRWWVGNPINLSAILLALAAIVLSAWWPIIAIADALIVGMGPLGLSVRGRTSALSLTRRLRTLLITWVLLQAAVVVAGVLISRPALLAAIGLVGVPVLMDAACALNEPIERRLLKPFLRSASNRLSVVAPTVVAVTGSYGKTSTKNHIAQLISGSLVALATPASFNNRAGLSKAINEQLSEGTQVFIAEMGTYGPGEIAELCSWFPPSIAVITAIGPVHLERFGSEEEIVRAKAEITVGARVVVLNVDDSRLSRLADQLSEDASKKIIRCSGRDTTADVCVISTKTSAFLYLGGEMAASEVAVESNFLPTNVACAVAVAIELGVEPARVLDRLADLSSVPHRLSIGKSPNGVIVLDDTFNSNPAGASAALETLISLGESGRRVVVTPGMVELGHRQFQENESFAGQIALRGVDLVVVGRTNRRALLKGAVGLRPVVVRNREEAVNWVRSHLGAGDAVLYENDLPDHYP